MFLQHAISTAMSENTCTRDMHSF